jgi:hypothetical protein
MRRPDIGNFVAGPALAPNNDATTLDRRRKMLRNAVIFVCAIYCLVVGSRVSAQDASFLTDPCGCNAGLKELKITKQTDYKLQYAYLMQIDEKQYNELTKKLDTNASYYEVIKGTGNYKEFDSRRHDYLQSVKFSMSVTDSLNYVLSMTPTADWSGCKKACIAMGSADSFLCGVTQVTDAQIAATCSWKATGVQSVKTIAVQVNGKSLPPKVEIPPNTLRDTIIARGKSDQLITFTLQNGPSRTVTVAKLPIVGTIVMELPKTVHHVETLSSSGIWVVPVGIVFAQVTVKAYGAGGGGGGGGAGYKNVGNRLGSGGGAGGNAGGFIEAAVPTKGLPTIPYTLVPAVPEGPVEVARATGALVKLGDRLNSKLRRRGASAVVVVIFRQVAERRAR